MRKKKLKTDEDYVRLDEAIGVIEQWREEILDELIKNGTGGFGWKALGEVMQAMQRVWESVEIG